MQGTGGFGRCNIATGSVPLPPFLLLLAPIRTAQRQFLFLLNPLHRFFLPSRPCPALSPAPQPPSARHCIILGSEISPPASSSIRPPPSIHPGRRSTSDDSSPLPPQRHTLAVCYIVVLVNLSVSRSPTWAIRRPQSQQQGQHRCGPRSPIFCFEQRRERAQDPLLSPLFPLSRFLSNRAVHRHKKKRAKKNPPSQVDSSTRMKHQHQ